MNIKSLSLRIAQSLDASVQQSLAVDPIEMHMRAMSLDTRGWHGWHRSSTTMNATVKGDAKGFQVDGVPFYSPTFLHFRNISEQLQSSRHTSVFPAAGATATSWLNAATAEATGMSTLLLAPLAAETTISHLNGLTNSSVIPSVGALLTAQWIGMSSGIPVDKGFQKETKLFSSTSSDALVGQVSINATANTNTNSYTPAASPELQCGVDAAGNAIFITSDGSQITISRDPATGEYTATDGNGSLVSGANSDYSNGFLHSTVNVLGSDGYGYAASTALTLASLGGDSARVSFMTKMSETYAKSAQMLTDGASRQAAAANTWKGFADALSENHTGLSNHLNETSQHWLEQAKRSAQAAANAESSAAGASNVAKNINATYANAGAAVAAASLLSSLAQGDSNAIIRSSWGVLGGLLVGAALGALGAPLWAGLALGIGAGWLMNKIYDKYISPSYADLGNFWDNLFGYLHDQFGHEKSSDYRIARYDPLALDLDGDGKISSVKLDGLSGALFDHDGDGIRTATGWIGSQDGLLVRDLNGNGRIDSGKELFGDQTQMAGGDLASNGFQALASLDDNHDGVVDATDQAFSTLRVWRDINGDGFTDEGELLTLAELGITSIATGVSSSGVVDVEGGVISAAGSFTRVDEAGHTSTGLAADFDFNSDAMASSYSDHIVLDDTVKDLPDLRGMGFVRSLREACMLSPALKQALEAFSAASTRNAQRALRRPPALSSGTV